MSQHDDYDFSLEEGTPVKTTNFDEAVNSIVGAAKKFKSVFGNSDEDNTPWPSNDENPYSPRIPAGAFCLRLAHQVWRDTCPLEDITGDTIIRIAESMDRAQRFGIIDALQHMNDQSDATG